MALGDIQTDGPGAETYYCLKIDEESLCSFSLACTVINRQQLILP